MYIVSNPFYEFRYRWYWFAYFAAVFKSRRISLPGYKYRIVRHV